MEYIPNSLSKLIKGNRKERKIFTFTLVKLYMFQILRALLYLEAHEIMHRDIKPSNILITEDELVSKLCDFGSAKKVLKNDNNISYICSRFYRAPELLFGSNEYNQTIDLWSLGCVMAEMLLGEILFPGESTVEQIVEIIKVLGTPTKKELKKMNPNYNEYSFPQIKCHPWHRVSIINLVI